MAKRFTIALLLLIARCANGKCPFARSTPAQANHVVLCWLKEPGNEAQRQQLIDASYTFRKIPGVVSVSAGRSIASTRPVVDSSFDVGIVIVFTDEAALHAYDQNPIHKKAVSDVLRPLTAKLVIYDVKRAEANATKR